MLFSASCFAVLGLASQINARALATDPVTIIDGLPSLSPFKNFNVTLSNIISNTSGISTINDDQIAALGLIEAEDYTSASLCPIVRQGKWSCGEACQAENSTILLLEGGDNEGLPYYYVAYNPTEQVLILAHKGTNDKSIDSLLDDADITLVDAEDFGFENTGGAQIHHGFANAHQQTIQDIVQVLTQETATGGKAENATALLITGHSLGSSIAQLDAMYLASGFPNLVQSTILFGCPRVGDQAWADYVDSTLGSSILRINNRNDAIPHVPFQWMGFEHPSNEFWINPNGAHDFCTGNDSSLCANSISFWDTSIEYHSGPYLDGTHMLGECTGTRRRVRRSRVVL